MTISPRRLQILKFLDRLTRHGEVPITDAARAIGGGFSGTQSRLYELIRLGYLQKHKQDGQFAHISVTDKGRAAIAGKEHSESSEAEAEDDRAIACRKNHPPQQKISAESRRLIYRGARYENFKGLEIIDRTPIPASRSLEGYRSSEAT